MTIGERLIDFIYVGPDKAASTWLWTEMLATPSMATPSTKDLFFFDRNFHLGMEWYWRQFDDAGNESANDLRVMEFGHDYIYSDTALRRIHQHNPCVTYVMMLRDPLERAASAFLYMKSQGRLPKSMTFAEAIESQPELVDHGLYASHLGRLRELTGTESIILLDFQLLKRSRADFIDSVRELLDVPDFGTRPESADVINPSRTARSPLVVKSGRRVLGALRTLGLASMAGRIKASKSVNAVLFRASQPESVSEVMSSCTPGRELEAKLRSDAEKLMTNYSFLAAEHWRSMQ